MNEAPHTKIVHALYGTRTPLLFETYSSSKYNTTLVFTLDAFECVFEEPHFNNALLKHESFTSTIVACFNDYIYTFSPYVVRPSLLWDSFILTQELSRSIDLRISRFDASKTSVLFDSLYFT
jgi:hypothetical protein